MAITTYYRIKNVTCNVFQKPLKILTLGWKFKGKSAKANINHVDVCSGTMVLQANHWSLKKGKLVFT